MSDLSIMSVFLSLVTVFCLFIEVTSQHKLQRIWTFAFSNDGFPANFVENNKIIGQSVDLVKEVCKFAGKKCKMALVQRQQCWDNSKGFPPYSLALNNAWFDSCANLPPNPERRLSYAFGDEDFYSTPEPHLIVREDSRITLDKLKDCNDFTIAYPGDTAVEPDCLLDAGYFVKKQKYVPVRLPGTSDLEKVMSKIMELVRTRKVDMALTIPRFVNSMEGVRTLTTVPCFVEVPLGLNVMMRPDNVLLQEWWSDSLLKFMCGSRYKVFCKKMEDEYDVDPLCRIPGKDLDCSKVGGPKASINYKKKDRITPCVDDDCPKKRLLAKGERFFTVRDKRQTSVDKALGEGGFKDGKPQFFEGPVKEDVILHITAPGEQLFSVGELCVMVKDAKSLKFVFRGGDRAAKEVDVPIKSEFEWTRHCEKHDTRRRRVVLKFRVAERGAKSPRVRIQGLRMEGCLD